MTQSPDYHFGWIDPAGEEVGSYAIRIEGAALPEDVWSECEIVLNCFAKLRPFLINYLVLDDYYGDVQKLPGALDAARDHTLTELHKFGGVAIKLLAACDKAVNGFLAAGQTFRERLLSRKKIATNDDHPVRHRIRELEAQYALYRLLCQLRNLGLHNEAVFGSLPLHVGPDSEEESTKLTLRKAELLARLDKSKRRAVGNLAEMPESIDFLEAANLYMKCNRLIFSSLLISEIDQVGFSMGFMRHLAEGARGLPATAQPLIFKGVPPEISEGKFSKGTIANADTILFPTHEYQALLKVFPEFSKPA